MIRTVQDFKKFIGKEIIAKPTGSNARGRSSEIDTFFVESCGRKYVKLSRVLSTRLGKSIPDNYLPETGATQSCINEGYTNNAGYLFFESMVDYKVYQEFQNKCNHVDQWFRKKSVRSLPIDVIDMIYDFTKES